MLAETRRCLRITSTAFDDEIQDLLDAAALDLKLAGITEEKINERGALIKRALMTYAKAHFGLGNTEQELIHAMYTNIKQHLLLSKEYTEAE